MITDFLKTETSKRNLKIALRIIQEFKYSVKEDEWVNLERLEEFLCNLVYKWPLKQDTLNHIINYESEDSEG